MDAGEEDDVPIFVLFYFFDGTWWNVEEVSESGSYGLGLFVVVQLCRVKALDIEQDMVCCQNIRGNYVSQCL